MKKHKVSTKKVLLIIGFILLNVSVILITAFSEFGNGNEAVSYRSVVINWRWILIAVLLTAIAVFLETLKFMILTKASCGQLRWGLSLRTVLFGKYYDNITPSGLGGQPFQIYYMSEGGVPSAQSTAIPLISITATHFAFIMITLVCLIAGGYYLKLEIIHISAWVGLVCYAFLPTMVLMSAFFPKFTSMVVKWFVDLLGRFHLIHRVVERGEKAMRTVEQYAVCVKEVVKQPLLCAITILISLFYQACIFAIPYFILVAFGGTMSFEAAFVSTSAIYASITFIPTPGNAGAAEGSFYAMFSSLTQGYVFWAMLVWRFLSYYIFILIGIVMYIVRAFRTHTKLHIISEDEIKAENVIKE